MSEQNGGGYCWRCLNSKGRSCNIYSSYSHSKPFCLFTVDLGTNQLFAVKQQSFSNPSLTTFFTTDISPVYWMPLRLPNNFKGSEMMVKRRKGGRYVKAPFASSVPELRQMLKWLSLPLLTLPQFYVIFFCTWETARFFPLNNLKFKTVSLSYLTYL